MLVETVNGETVVSTETDTVYTESELSILRREAARVEETRGCYRFYFNDCGAAYACLEKIRRIMKNKDGAKRRRELEEASPGTHTKQDVFEILVAQNHECYFTGTPLREGEYDKDHLEPVSKIGTFWPDNIALVTREVNNKKGSLGKNQFWRVLEKEYGQDWVKRRKEICKIIDKEREKIAKRRKSAVAEKVAELERQIALEFTGHPVFVRIIDDYQISLCIDENEVLFAPGLVRRPSRMNDPSYFVRVAEAVIGDHLAST